MKHFFKKNWTWIVFAALIVSLLYYFLWIVPPQNSGGDIVEYFGMTESLRNHQGVHLTALDMANLRQSLNPGYFVNVLSSNQKGGFLYYLTGRNGQKYPVHFFFYSLISMPERFILGLAHMNELNALRFSNVVILALMIFVVFKNYIQTSFKRIVFLFLVFASPITSFLIWPGPDVLYLSLVIVGIYLFSKKRYVLAALCAAVASWHSQPLIILSIATTLYYLITTFRIEVVDGKHYFGVMIKALFVAAGIGAVALIPYFYNIYAFGLLTPWTIIPDGWTQLYGFGIQNIRLQKFYEQIFDLNMGLLWFAPVIVVSGLFFFVKDALKQKMLWIGLAVVVITMFAYQTNPGWQYGTAGYGPTRHSIFLLPFCFYFIINHIKQKLSHFIILALIVVTQIYVFTFNGFLTPNFINVLNNTPYATFVLDHFPALYSPTPDIFVGRVNHTDYKYLQTAIYKYNGKCTKAYVLLQDEAWVKHVCGYIPKQYEQQFQDPLNAEANYPRQVKTIEATLWPDPYSCTPGYVPSGEHNFVCIKNLQTALKAMNISDPTRIHAVPNLPGVWRIDTGDVVDLTIPPGYLAQYYAMKGMYVTY